jgi:pentose-5-phosphate-3-epimerase
MSEKIKDYIVKCLNENDDITMNGLQSQGGFNEITSGKFSWTVSDKNGNETNIIMMNNISQECIDSFIELIDNDIIDFVQVMGIANIGYQGEPFQEESLDIISNLKERYPDLVISIDGGVSVDTIADLHDAGVDRFVSGSGVYGDGSADENIYALGQLLNRE